MNKITLLYVFIFGILFSTNQNMVMEKANAKVGIFSIIEDDKNIIINIYSINQIPIAGFEFDITPNDLFVIDSISGGICGQLGFALHSNPKGKLLAFSLEGKQIPKSESALPEDNILFSVYGKKNKSFLNEAITLKATLANRMGKRVHADVVEYINSKGQ